MDHLEKPLKNTFCSPVLAFTLLMPVVGLAQEGDSVNAPPVERTLEWSLGLGVASTPRPYVGAENAILPIPLVDITYKKFWVQGIQAGYWFVDSKKFDFGVRAGIVFESLDPDDSDFLTGLEERKPSIQGGLVFGWKPGKFRLTTAVNTDLLNRSNGQQVSVDFSRMWQWHGRAIGIMPSIGVVWQSSNFINYYYGVTPEESLPGRPPFSGHSAVNFRGSVLGYIFVSHRIRFVAYLEVQRLDNEIYDSPIVEDRRSVLGLFGVTCRLGKISRTR
jgi:outer membrane protein